MAVIEGGGTPEAAWQADARLAAVPTATLREMLGTARSLAVLAPHPDDELLGCGGLMAQCAAAGIPVRVLAVTDGEASHGALPDADRTALAERRRAERRAGLDALGLGDATIELLGLPDGGVTAHAADLHERLLGLLRPGDAVVATWEHDAHPDHDAVGAAARAVTATRGLRLLQMPVWTWHWAAPGDDRVPWPRLRALPLDADTLARKRAAVAQHRSQLDPRPGEPPVLTPDRLPSWLRPHEYFFR